MQTCGLTIGAAGCAITSLAVINNKYNATRNPAQVNTLLGSAACPVVWGTAASKLGLQWQYPYYNSSGVTVPTVRNLILGILRNNRPVLLGLKIPNGNTHYAVVRGYIAMSDGSYTFYVHDPGSLNRTTLQQLMNDTWKIIQVFTYYK